MENDILAVLDRRHVDEHSEEDPSSSDSNSYEELLKSMRKSFLASRNVRWASLPSIVEDNKFIQLYILRKESGYSWEKVKNLPIVKRNVCYICCAVLFDDHDRVVLVQEAKPSCFGQWYLPAGRLEAGETIIDGTKREVKEESGLECDLTTLLSVELNGSWMRFTFTGKITGGKLKTLGEKDKESLQANFFSQNELPLDISFLTCGFLTSGPTKRRINSDTPSRQGGPVVLRCNDILKLIALGRKYRQERNYLCLPVVHPHKYISNRFVIIDKEIKNISDPIHVLTCTKGGIHHIPSLRGNINKNTNITTMIATIFKAAFSIGISNCPCQLCGLLGVEHRGTGKEEDGVCVTLLIRLDLKDGQALPQITSSEYTWDLVCNPQIQSRLKDACDQKIVPIL